ncbi:MAG: hypothetical protein MR006_02835, partial [Arcanobacterium sp.]|nr:hypothetical protein [Arcanobacterium sp.]
MRSLLRTLKTKTGLAALLAAILFILVASISAGIIFPASVPVVVVTVTILSVQWLIVVLYLISNRFTLVALAVDTRLTLAKQDSLFSKAEEINTRVRKIATVTNNTAGSAGRSAPIIRKIENSVATIEGALSGALDPKPLTSGHNLQDLPNKMVSKIPPANMKVTDAKRRITAAVIADEFTINAFSPEWNQVLPTPENWREILKTSHPDLFFIESAWEANSGTWRYQLVGKSAPSQAIKDAISYAKSLGIPVVFWNKEDPPHFYDFLPMAKLADYVFTTESSLIPAYKEHLGHNRVAVLPFAAQPRFHNPAVLPDIPRNRSVAFGGMYFRDKYPERRAQMEYLLPAAHKFNLDIFSRQYGKGAQYEFPSPFQDDVVGSLSYPQMVNAYKVYKTILNVNSVPESESMCARRIFEATACGAAVVSPPTNAIQNYFNDTITTVSNEDEAQRALRLL